MQSRSSFLKCNATSMLCLLGEVPHLVKPLIALHVLLNLSLYSVVDIWRSFFLVNVCVPFPRKHHCYYILGLEEIKGRGKFMKLLTSDSLEAFA